MPTGFPWAQPTQATMESPGAYVALRSPQRDASGAIVAAIVDDRLYWNGKGNQGQGSPMFTWGPQGRQVMPSEYATLQQTYGYIAVPYNLMQGYDRASGRYSGSWPRVTEPIPSGGSGGGRGTGGQPPRPRNALTDSGWDPNTGTYQTGTPLPTRVMSDAEQRAMSQRAALNYQQAVQQGRALDPSDPRAQPWAWTTPDGRPVRQPMGVATGASPVSVRAQVFGSGGPWGVPHGLVPSGGVPRGTPLPQSPNDPWGMGGGFGYGGDPWGMGGGFGFGGGDMFGGGWGFGGGGDMFGGWDTSVPGLSPGLFGAANPAYAASPRPGLVQTPDGDWLPEATVKQQLAAVGIFPPFSGTVEWQGRDGQSYEWELEVT